MAALRHLPTAGLLLALLLASACASQLPEQEGTAPMHPARLLLQKVPANCTSQGDQWTPSKINCSLEASGFTFECTYDADSGNARCQLQGPQPMQLIGMTCPVKQGKALCDMVVAQNFTPSDVVFAVVELLAAWSPAA